MSMGTSILALMGRRDPREKLLTVQGGQQATAPATTTVQAGAQYPDAAALDPAAVAAQQAQDAARTVPQQPQQAEAYTSPQDLMGMYKELMEYNSRAQNVDRGIALLGSAFAHPENRANIMSAFSPSGDNSIGNIDPIAIQKGIMELRDAETARTQKAALLASIPAIAAKYGIDRETAMMLAASDQLDDFVAEREKAQFTRDNEAPATATNNGQTIGFDKRTGKELYRIGVADQPDKEFQKVGDTLHILDKKTGAEIRQIKNDDPEYINITDTDGTTMIVAKKDPTKVIARLGQPKVASSDDTVEYDKYVAQEKANNRPAKSFEEWMLSTKKAGANQVTVNNNQQKEFDKQMGTEQAKRYAGYQAAAENARKSKSQYELAEKALETGLETGFGADTMLAARKVGQVFGMDVDEGKIAAAETLKAASNQMAMLKRNPESGMGLPGSVSDRDLQFLKDSDFNLGTSVPGNKTLITVAKRMAERNEIVAMMAADYVKEHGQLDTGWDKKLKEFADANPMFDDINIGKGQTHEERLKKAANKYGVTLDGQ